MKSVPRKRWGRGKTVTLASIGGLAATAAALVVLSTQTAFQPLLLIGMLLLLPAAVNLLLLIPHGTPIDVSASAKEAPDGEVEKPSLLQRLRVRFRSAAHACRAFAVKHRTVLLVVAMILIMIGINVLFWLFAREKSYGHRFGYFSLVAMGVCFVLFIVFAKCCAHTVEQIGEDAGGYPDVRYDTALLCNMQSAFVLGRVALILSALTEVVGLLKLYDFTSWLVVLLSVLFAYKTVFMMISLFVVLVRRELDIAPEITAPAPGVRGGDLGILSYLEKNTGISMRSLWSIQMIKKAIPYAVLGIVLLLWGATGVSLVNSDQQGAYYRFGKLQEQTLSPGIHLTLPWPFARVEVYNTGTVNQLTVGYVAEETADNFWTEAHGGEEYRLLLGNGNELVSINLRVMYRIGDLRAYLTSSATPELLMSAASYEIVTARTITSDLDTMLSTDRAVFADSFRAELMTYMERYNTGLTVVDVVLESIHPPVEVADAYQALISAEIDADRIVIDAEAYRGDRLAWAWIDYDSEISMATVEGKEALAAATSAVAEFLASVEADKAYPGDYRYYKYMKAVTEAYSGAKLVIVGDGVNEENIYIGSISSGEME